MNLIRFARLALGVEQRALLVLELLVLGVTAARIESARRLNPSSARVWTITGVASASLICSTSVGHPGMCVMTSSPGPNSTIAAL